MEDYRITAWSDTCIKDQDAIDFINKIQSMKLRRIIREHFESECYNHPYNLKKFKEEFIEYLSKEDIHHYFLPGLNDRLEDILKKLLYIKWN